MPPRSKLHLLLCFVAAFLAFAAGSITHAETFRNPTRIPLAADPYGVTTGDLNGDGRNDIVWTELPAYPGTPLLHVLLAGANGQYTAAPSLSLPFALTRVQCLIEDVTGDKQNDLVCVAPSSDYTNVYLFTYPGNGDGTFGAPVQTKVSSSTVFSDPILARAGDINSDGLPDIILMNAYYSGTLPYLSDGQGGFKLATSFNGSFNFSVPTITDLNGDGKLDVLWPTGPRVNLGNGDGTFSAPIAYDPGYLSNCAFGDVDNDGHLDAVCTWIDTLDIDGYVHLTVLHGNPDGSFSPTPIFTRTFGNGEIGYDGFATITTPVLIADLNGDGNADIISLSGDGYCVLLGGPNATWNGQPQQFVTASFQSEGGIQGIYGVSIADMNGDGVPDVVAIGPHGLYITYGQKDGTLSSAPAPEVGQVSTSATLVDVNGDGNLDVVSVGDIAVKLSLGRGDGTFNSPQPITTSDNFGEVNYVKPVVVSGDFNGDGKQDFIATGSTAAYTAQAYMLFGHGDGTFATPAPITLATLGKVADLNNDGRSDVISILNNGPITSALVASLSRGDGTFTTESTSLPVETNNGFTAPFAGPALADFRHSGQLDAAVATQNNAYLLRSLGNGAFTAAAPLAIPNLANLSKTAVSDVTAADFDGDGNTDFAVVVQYGSGAYNLSTPTSAAWVFYGNGDGTFSSPVLAGTFDRLAQAVNSGDLNGDGLADLVLTSYSVYQYNGVLIVHALPNRAWGPEFDYTGGDGLAPFWITDINHDGRNDLIFSNAARGNLSGSSVSVLLSQASASVTGILTATPDPSNVTYSFTLQATLIPSNASDVLTGNVVFSIDGTAVGTVALASSNTATFNLSGIGFAAGSHTLSASWAGNSTYPAVTLSGTHGITLLPLDIALAASPASGAAGSKITATATFTPGKLPAVASYQYTGILTLYDNGVATAQQQVSASGFSFALSSLAVGTHVLSMSYGGDPLFATAQSNSATVTITGAPSTSTLTATPGTASYGTPVALTATIAATNPAAAPAPTGTITFTVDGTSLSPIALTNAKATITLPNLASGAHTASCTYSGDSTFASSICNSVPVTITAGASALTIVSSQNPSIAFVPVTFTIHLTLNGQPAAAGMQFTFGPSSNSSNVLLTTDASGSATYTTNQLFARTWNTVALFTSNNYVNSSAQYAQVVTAAPTTLSLSALPNPAYLGQTVTFTAGTTPSGTTFPTGSVTFSEGATVLGSGTLSSTGQATFSASALAVGTHIVTASYVGDSGFSGASSNSVSEVVLNNGFTINLQPASLSLTSGADGTAVIQLGSLGNFSGPLQLTLGAAPTYASMSLSAPSVTLAVGGSGSSTLTIHTLAIADLHPSNQPLAGRSSGIFAASLASLFLCSLLPAGRGARSRRLHRALLTLVAAATLSASIGCLNSWYMRNSVADGVYSVPITATDAARRTQTAILSLTVTQ